MSCGVYEIRCPPTRKGYIGHSKDIEYRWYTHLYDLRRNQHSNPLLQNAYNKYGEESFEFIILEECPEEKLIDREQSWFDSSNFEHLFNLNRRAERPPSTKGRKDTPEQSKARSDRMKGRKMPPKSEEYRKAASNRMKGNDHAKGPQKSPRSSEHREKLRQSRLGKSSRKGPKPAQSEAMKRSWANRKAQKGQ